MYKFYKYKLRAKTYAFYKLKYIIIKVTKFTSTCLKRIQKNQNQ